MTVSVSVSLSMSGPYLSVRNRVRVCFQVLAHVSDCVDQSVPAHGHVSVRDHVRVHVHVRDRVRVRDRIRSILSISVVVPVMSSAHGWGRDHIFERVTVRVAACTFSVVVSMHNHASVRVSVNVCFRVLDHVSVRVRCRARIHGHVRVNCRFWGRAGGHASFRDRARVHVRARVHIRDHVRVRVE